MNKEIDVVEDILSGNKEAFNGFYEQYDGILLLHTSKWIHRIKRESLNLYDFDDLHNELWECVLNKMPNYDKEKAAISTWLYMICNQKCQRIIYDSNAKKRRPENQDSIISIDLQTSEDKDSSCLADFIEDDSEDFSSIVLTELEMIEIIYKVHKSIASLSDTRKHIYLLSLQGLKMEEIGSILGCSKQNVSAHMMVIKEKLYNIYTSKLPINYKDAYSLMKELTSECSDDKLCLQKEYQLSSVKICRKIINLLGFI